MFKALANPHRLRIFIRLAQCCTEPGCCDIHSISTCVGDLGADLGIVPSTVSHHIKELREAGLINVSRQGQHMNCWVDPEVVRDLMAFFKDCTLEENIS